MTYRKLTEEQVALYEEQGYIRGLPVFGEAEITRLNAELKELEKLFKPGESHIHTAEWHQSSRWLYDICTTPQILAYVEGLLGKDFYLWGSAFFAKPPHSDAVVPWHQDAYYWELYPHRTVTAWVAFTDADEENGAMKLIPGSHRAGIIKHRENDAATNLLTLELEEGTFSEGDAVSLNLRAGEISIHDDALAHGSPANHSDRWRIGFTIRYSATEVKADPDKWPDFKTWHVSGIDRYRHNKTCAPPIEKFARPAFSTWNR